ncbi:MAG TPA: hypothetical protein VMH86_08980 [Rhizomicrobium sp.]|nr:hypothetical protein [Rhizomicrobium sp.]
MKAHWRRALTQFAISAFVAAVTPAVAAGVVAGVSVAARTVGNAAAEGRMSDLDDGAGAVPANAPIATAAPRRLTALSGDDSIAWEDAHAAARHARLARPR